MTDLLPNDTPSHMLLLTERWYTIVAYGVDLILQFEDDVFDAARGAGDLPPFTAEDVRNLARALRQNQTG